MNREGNDAWEFNRADLNLLAHYEPLSDRYSIAQNSIGTTSNHHHHHHHHHHHGLRKDNDAHRVGVSPTKSSPPMLHERTKEPNTNINSTRPKSDPLLLRRAKSTRIRTSHHRRHHSDHHPPSSCRELNIGSSRKPKSRPSERDSYSDNYVREHNDQFNGNNHNHNHNGTAGDTVSMKIQQPGNKTVTAALKQPTKEWVDLVDLDQLQPEMVRPLLKSCPNTTYCLQSASTIAKKISSRQCDGDDLIQSWYDIPSSETVDNQHLNNPSIVKPATVSLVQRQLEQQHLVVKRDQHHHQSATPVLIYPTQVSTRKLNPNEVKTWADSPTYQKPKLTMEMLLFDDQRQASKRSADGIVAFLQKQQQIIHIRQERKERPPDEKRTQNDCRDGHDSGRRRHRSTRRKMHAPRAA